MRKTITCVLLVLGMLPLAGCQTVATMAVKHVAMSGGKKVAKKLYKDLKAKKNEPSAPAAAAQQEVLLVSLPMGAKVEVSGKHAGTTPVVVRLKLGADGTVARTYRIKAVPAEPSHHAQEVRLLHYSGEPSDRPPARITFDMAAPADKGVKISYTR